MKLPQVFSRQLQKMLCYGEKAGATDAITLTGGCAKNEGLKKAIEKVLHIEVIDLAIDPQLMGALGAAEYARVKGMNKEN